MDRRGYGTGCNCYSNPFDSAFDCWLKIDTINKSLPLRLLSGLIRFGCHFIFKQSNQIKSITLLTLVSFHSTFSLSLSSLAMKIDDSKIILLIAVINCSTF